MYSSESQRTQGTHCGWHTWPPNGRRDSWDQYSWQQGRSECGWEVWSQVSSSYEDIGGRRISRDSWRLGVRKVRMDNGSSSPSWRVPDKFPVLPKRWIVERSFACLENLRRLNIDYVFLADTAVAMVQWPSHRLCLTNIFNDFKTASQNIRRNIRQNKYLCIKFA